MKKKEKDGRKTVSKTESSSVLQLFDFGNGAITGLHVCACMCACVC